jgi:hypothetical protein
MARRSDRGEARRRAVLLALATLLAASCGRRSKDPPPTPPTAPATGGERLFDDARVESKLGGAGGSLKSPVPRCGPRDSYHYVASEFRCPGGGNPLEGDASAAARLRAGSVGPDARGHMIDVYEVPCPSGKVDVYVDMYGCEEMQRDLARDVAVQDPLQLDVKFAAGEYDEVRARCDALGDDPPGMTLFHCGVFAPALALRSGDVERAVATAGRTCQSYPPVGPRSNVRIDVTVAIVDAIARMWVADKVPAEEGGKRLATLLPKLLTVCGVEAEAFMSAFHAGE